MVNKSKDLWTGVASLFSRKSTNATNKTVRYSHSLGEWSGSRGKTRWLILHFTLCSLKNSMDSVTAFYTTLSQELFINRFNYVFFFNQSSSLLFMSVLNKASTAYESPHMLHSYAVFISKITF